MIRRSACISFDFYLLLLYEFVVGLLSIFCLASVFSGRHDLKYKYFSLCFFDCFLFLHLVATFCYDFLFFVTEIKLLLDLLYLQSFGSYVHCL